MQGKSIHYVVEWEFDNAECVNKYLDDCIERTKRIYNNIFISIINGNSESLLLFSKVHAGCIVDLVSKDIFSGNVNTYFPSRNPDINLLTIAIQSGIKIFQNDISNYHEVSWNDYFDGYLNNDNAEFYSKLFPEPVFIGNYKRLNLSLGSTINPRAIILNAGLDTKGVWVTLGRGSHIGADVLLNLGPTDFKVGNFSMISSSFSAHAMRHTITHASNYSMNKGPFKFLGNIYDVAEPITIGNDVWIGEGVTCLAGINIPDGCVVGAGSIVTSSLEPYGIYAGNPARLIRFRFESEKIEILRASKWWMFKYEKLKKINDVFKKDITSLNLDELKMIF